MSFRGVRTERRQEQNQVPQREVRPLCCDLRPRKIDGITWLTHPTADMFFDFSRRYSKACPSGGKGLTTRVEDMMHSRTKGGARKQRYMKAATMTRKAKNDEERKAQKSGKE